jgi:hypothetical protein
VDRIWGKVTRSYSSQTGAFIQEDGIGLRGGLNLYQYARSSPVTLTDPFGQWPALTDLLPFLPTDPANAPGLGDQTYLPGNINEDSIYLAAILPFGVEELAVAGGARVIRCVGMRTVTKEFAMRSVARGVRAPWIVNALRSPTKIVRKVDGRGRVTYQHHGNDAVVVTGPDGKLITVWAKHEPGF